MADLTLKKILLLMSLDNEELAIATGHLCEKIILGLTGEVVLYNVVLILLLVMLTML